MPISSPKLITGTDVALGIAVELGIKGAGVLVGKPGGTVFTGATGVGVWVSVGGENTGGVWVGVGVWVAIGKMINGVGVGVKKTSVDGKKIKGVGVLVGKGKISVDGIKIKGVGVLVAIGKKIVGNGSCASAFCVPPIAPMRATSTKTNAPINTIFLNMVLHPHVLHSKLLQNEL